MCYKCNGMDLEQPSNQDQVNTIQALPFKSLTGTFQKKKFYRLENCDSKIWKISARFIEKYQKE